MIESFISTLTSTAPLPFALRFGLAVLGLALLFDIARSWRRIARATERDPGEVLWAKLKQGRMGFSIEGRVKAPWRGHSADHIIIDDPLEPATKEQRKWWARLQRRDPCKRCGKPAAYPGAIYCGAGCAARAEEEWRAEDEE